MGFNEADGIAARYREEFPVTKELIYLNHAAVAPLCRRAAEAIRWLADDACQFGSLHYDKWMDSYAGVRKAAARLINGSPDEIAIIKNTSEGISIGSSFCWEGTSYYEDRNPLKRSQLRAPCLMRR